MKVHFRHIHIVGKGPVVIEDPDNGSVRTMVSKSTGAQGAFFAAAIDLPYHSLPSELAGLSRSNKFVAEHTTEIHIPFDQLQIGFADSRQLNSNALFAVSRSQRVVFMKLNVASIDSDGAQFGS